MDSTRILTNLLRRRKLHIFRLISNLNQKTKNIFQAITMKNPSTFLTIILGTLSSAVSLATQTVWMIYLKEITNLWPINWIKDFLWDQVKNSPKVLTKTLLLWKNRYAVLIWWEILKNKLEDRPLFKDIFRKRLKDRINIYKLHILVLLRLNQATIRMLWTSLWQRIWVFWLRKRCKQICRVAELAGYFKKSY